MAQAEEKQDAESLLRAKLLAPLEEMKVSDLQGNKPIVLHSETDPKKAIEVLLSNKVMAAPVSENGKFIGVLDLRDTVKYALQTYHKGAVDKAKAKAMEFLAVSPQISTNSLKYLSRMRNFATVKETDNVVSVVMALAKGHHIVGVVTEDESKLVSILTQGQIFQTVSKLWTFDNDLLLSKMAELKYVTTPVMTIRNTNKAYEAFDKMSNSNLSGLAVVNENDEIIHNTSATDIKLWLFASNSLDETIEQFLINIRKLSLLEKYPITVCGMDDSVSKAVAKLQATKYHRLWVVDEETKPVGVLALTDIFRFIVKGR